MDRTDEGAPRPLATPPPPVTAQPLRVNPDNVVELAILFQRAANDLGSELGSLGRALRLAEPWMNDRTSKWMRAFFHKYFVDGENSLLKVLQAIYEQHKAHADALEVAAAQYGKADELNAARAAQTDKLLGHLPA
jgi:hypothetical protein